MHWSLCMQPRGACSRLVPLPLRLAEHINQMHSGSWIERG